MSLNKTILIVYRAAETPARASLLTHLYSFGRYSNHTVFYLNLCVNRVPQHIRNMNFDLIIFRHRSGSKRQAHLGQGQALDVYCKDKDILFFEVDTINGEQCRKILRDLAPDLLVSAGNRILRRSVFAIPPLGAINLHTGKVPEYRGGPPFFWELYHGEKTVGATVHFIDAGIDAGPVIVEREFPILPEDTVNSLKARIIPEGARLPCEAITDPIMNA